MTFDDSATHRKPNACPFGFFYCVKGIKDCFKPLGWNSGPCIYNFCYYNILRPLIKCLYCECSTLCHRLEGVIKKVQKDLFHLIKIDLHRRKIFSIRLYEVDVRYFEEFLDQV